METRERLEIYLEAEGGFLPWSYGRSDELSERALICWKLLTPEEKLGVSKLNPLKKARNRLLCELRQEGFVNKVLVELSGLPISTLERITNNKGRGEKRSQKIP